MRIYQLAFVVVGHLWSSASDGSTPASRAQEIFFRLTGVPLQLTDSRLEQMANLIAQGKDREAAAIATRDDNFFNVTLRDWASVMDGREESILNPFSDYQALLIGATRDDRDFRTVLTGDYLYRSSSGLTFSQMETRNSRLQSELVPATQLAAAGVLAPVGAFTTFSWASNHYDGGTNRRAVEYTFKQFLCAPISLWKDAGLPDDMIRRDVDRAPAGNADNFQNLCRTCHAGMDALAGAFANYDFSNGSLIYLGNEVAAKYNRNSQTYPEGYQTADASFVNYSTQHHNASFGWRGTLEGRGLKAFATMIANSKGFSRCMVRRAFRKVCNRDPGAEDAAEIDVMTNEFEEMGYKMKTVFEAAATSTRCTN